MIKKILAYKTSNGKVFDCKESADKEEFLNEIRYIFTNNRLNRYQTSYTSDIVAQIMSEEIDKIRDVLAKRKAQVQRAEATKLKQKQKEEEQNKEQSPQIQPTYT